MILVTGGTGFVGREVVRQLRAAGHRVRVLARNPRKSPPAWRDDAGIELVAADGRDPAALATAMKEVTAVVHLVGIIMETPKISFEVAHTEVTAHILAAARAAGVQRYIQMSALGTRADAVSRYHRTKWAAEELVRASGLDWTIVRPSIIYGVGDKSLNVLGAFMRWPLDFLNCYTFPNFGGGAARVQPISVEEVAWVIVRALSNQVAIGKTYDLCGPEPITWSGILNVLAQRQGICAKFDASGLTFIARSFLWFLIMGLPLLAIIGGVMNLFGLGFWVILIAVWVAALLFARIWRTYIIYTVSWRCPLAAAWLAEKLLPRWLHFGEQLAMMREDNVGDPSPAQRDLHLTFRSF